ASAGHDRAARRDVQALRGLQAAHDADRLRRLLRGNREGAPGRGRARPAAGVPPADRAARGRTRGAGGGVSAGAATALEAVGGKRERNKAANRAAILSAAREVFADIGYGASSIRDIVRR